MTTFFVEQPLASPGYANHLLFSLDQRVVRKGVCSADFQDVNFVAKAWNWGTPIFCQEKYAHNFFLNIPKNIQNKLCCPKKEIVGVAAKPLHLETLKNFIWIPIRPLCTLPYFASIFGNSFLIIWWNPIYSTRYAWEAASSMAELIPIAVLFFSSPKRIRS